MPEGSLNSIAKYIQNEKDISKYKLSLLERIKDPSPSQKRIIDIEREFLSLPLEGVSFLDVADVAAAISIYRTSRSHFFDLYKLNDKEEHKNKKSMQQVVSNKLSFLKKCATDFKTSKVQEVNPIQSSEFYYDLIKKVSQKSGRSFDLEKKILDSKDLPHLLSIEPAIVAKKRARCQAATYSLGNYLEKSLSKIGKDTSIEELDRIISNIDNNIFAYYNESIVELQSMLPNTMGQNPHITRIHPLQNVLDFSNLNSSNFRPVYSNNFPKNKPVITNILFNIKDVISVDLQGDKDKGVQNKVFGILLPVLREGNEKMSLLHKEIIVDDIDISEMFSDVLSNVKAVFDDKEVYCKAILMLPFWKLHALAKDRKEYGNILMQLLSLSGSFDDIDFNDEKVIEKINKTAPIFINILNNSRVLSTKTRVEDENISDVISIIKSKISELKEEYNLL